MYGEGTETETSLDRSKGPCRGSSHRRISTWRLLRGLSESAFLCIGSINSNSTVQLLTEGRQSTILSWCNWSIVLYCAWMCTKAYGPCLRVLYIVFVPRELNRIKRTCGSPLTTDKNTIDPTHGFAYHPKQWQSASHTHTLIICVYTHPCRC